MRRASRRDSNHQEIVAELSRRGFKVLDLSRVGGGCPDILVGVPRQERPSQYPGFVYTDPPLNVLLEIKVPKSGRLNAKQKKFRESWPGPVYVVRDVVQALAALQAVGARAGE